MNDGRIKKNRRESRNVHANETGSKRNAGALFSCNARRISRVLSCVSSSLIGYRRIRARCTRCSRVRARCSWCSRDGAWCTWRARCTAGGRWRAWRRRLTFGEAAFRQRVCFGACVHGVASGDERRKHRVERGVHVARQFAVRFDHGAGALGNDAAGVHATFAIALWRGNWLITMMQTVE